MPFQPLFMDSSSVETPDLTLHISPPNSSAPSSMCNSNSEPETAFDLFKSNSEGSVRQDSIAYTELCLTNPTAPMEAESPWRRITNKEFLQQIPQKNHYSHLNRSAHPNNCSSDHLNQSIAFIGANHLKEMVPSWPFSLYSSLPSSSSSVSPPLVEGGWDSSALLHPLQGYQIAGSTRFNGLSPNFLKTQHCYNPHSGMGASEGFHGMVRSRFMTKFPTKRSMRAPRMRWTSTLHARFVHAVELLGGHESNQYLPLS